MHFFFHSCFAKKRSNLEDVMNRNIGNEHCDKNTNYLSCCFANGLFRMRLHTESTKHKHGKQNTEGQANMNVTRKLSSRLDEHSVDNGYAI